MMNSNRFEGILSEIKLLLSELLSLICNFWLFLSVFESWGQPQSHQLGRATLSDQSAKKDQFNKPLVIHKTYPLIIYTCRGFFFDWKIPDVLWKGN